MTIYLDKENNVLMTVNPDQNAHLLIDGNSVSVSDLLEYAYRKGSKVHGPFDEKDIIIYAERVYNGALHVKYRYYKDTVIVSILWKDEEIKSMALSYYEIFINRNIR